MRLAAGAVAGAQARSRRQKTSPMKASTGGLGLVKYHCVWPYTRGLSKVPVHSVSVCPIMGVIVITSYSIHYTKLYDKVPEAIVMAVLARIRERRGRK